TGLDILDAVRRVDPALPVMFLTGATDVDSAVRALEGGAMRYLTKPVRPAEEDRRLDAAMAQLYMVFQPIVSWSRRKVIGVVALMRSHPPEIGRPDKL